MSQTEARSCMKRALAYQAKANLPTPGLALCAGHQLRQQPLAIVHQMLKDFSSDILHVYNQNLSVNHLAIILIASVPWDESVVFIQSCLPALVICTQPNSAVRVGWLDVNAFCPSTSLIRGSIPRSICTYQILVRTFGLLTILKTKLLFKFKSQCDCSKRSHLILS